MNIEPECMRMMNDLYLLRIEKTAPMYGSIMIPSEARKNLQYGKVVASPGDHLKGKLVIYEPAKGFSPDGDIRNDGIFLITKKEHILAVVEFE